MNIPDLHQFEYDPELPLQWTVHGSEGQDGVRIHDVSYASPGHGTIRAYWVSPNGDGPFPGVIFVHPAPGDRSTFLEEAVSLSQHGIASLLVEAPWAQLEAWGQTMGEPGHDREEFIRTAIDLMRAVDALASRGETDSQRLGYVGHSYGALLGGLLSGVEKRLRAFVLMAGVGSFTDIAALNDPSLQGETLQKYQQGLSPIDPVHSVAKAAPAALFFQFGEQDDFLPREKAMEFAGAASEPKQIRWYDTDHFFSNHTQAQMDRAEWLLEHL